MSDGHLLQRGQLAPAARQPAGLPTLKVMRCFIFASETEKLNRHAAGKYRRPGQSMSITFELREWNKANSKRRNQNDGHHSRDCCRAENRGDGRQAPEAALCGGVHQQGNQRFAGTENKDRKQHPRCNASAGLLRVGVQVVGVVRVSMFMRQPAAVGVKMLVGFVSNCPPNTPYEVCEAEGY